MFGILLKEKKNTEEKYMFIKMTMLIQMMEAIIQYRVFLKLQVNQL